MMLKIYGPTIDYKKETMYIFQINNTTWEGGKWEATLFDPKISIKDSKFIHQELSENKPQTYRMN